jgi:hypothetical protein
MSALRYSGALRIRVTYLEPPGHSLAWPSGRSTKPNGEYRCAIRSTDHKAIVCTIVVGAPAVLSHAVDSPEAFDDAARAALSFADVDWPVAENAATTDSGWHIGRSPSKAWPEEPKRDTIQSPPPDECLPPVLDPTEARR